MYRYNDEIRIVIGPQTGLSGIRSQKFSLLKYLDGLGEGYLELCSLEEALVKGENDAVEV